MPPADEPQVLASSDPAEAVIAAMTAAACHPRVAEAIQYWCRIRPGPGLLPGRRHVDPVDVPRLLPHIGLLDVVREPRPRLKVRLVGTKVTQSVGTGILGRFLDDVVPDLETSRVGQDYLYCVTEGVPVWYRGEQTITLGKAFLQVERLFMPLAADGLTVDMVFAVYIFGTTKKMAVATL